MSGRRRLSAGKPRLLGRHDGKRGRWYSEAWAAISAEFGQPEGLRRIEAGRLCTLWVALRSALEAVEEARRAHTNGRGRRPSSRELERLSRRAGLADTSWAQGLAAFRELAGSTRRKPASGAELLWRREGSA